jgi:hypothetical protein
MAFVYLLASKPYGTLYTGSTVDLARRILAHKSKIVPGFTPKKRHRSASLELSPEEIVGKAATLATAAVAAALFIFISASASAQQRQVMAVEPAWRQSDPSWSMYLYAQTNDGRSCPPGQVWNITAGSASRNIPRQYACVPDPRLQTARPPQ